MDVPTVTLGVVVAPTGVVLYRMAARADASDRAERDSGSSSELDPASDGRCPCGGPLTPDGVCPDRCARDTWETGR